MKQRSRFPMFAAIAALLFLGCVFLLRQSNAARVYAYSFVDMLSGGSAASIQSGEGETPDYFQRIGQLSEVIDLANRHHYQEVETDEMLEGAIRGAVAALNDPYSFYLSPVQKQREQEDMFQGKFGGLGINILPESKGDYSVVKIIAVLPGTPAEKAGLLSGDAIVEIEGESSILGGANGLTMDDILMKLRGKAGDPVTIKVQRRNRREPLEKTLVRGVITPKSVYWKTLEPGIVYLKLETFKRQSMQEFVSALREANAPNKMRALIFDLRNNTGGMLETANAIADAFLDDGLIVYTQGKYGQYNDELRATKSLIVPKDVEVVVLVNQRSASGSEIVAGALKDHQRAVLIGEKTYGKGLVQKRMNLKNGGAVSLTISTYYTPNGTSINNEGIPPHIEVTEPTLSEEEAFNRQRARDSHILSDYVQDFIAEHERMNGETPTDFALLEPKLHEIKTLLDKVGIELSDEILWLDARSEFDRNVGNRRLVDLEYDTQLKEAVRLIKSGETRAALNNPSARDAEPDR